MDVRSLYTSIPNKEGITTTKKRFDSYIHKTLPTKTITTFLALILLLNNFVFKILPTNKRLCHGYNLCCGIYKYLHGLIWTKIHLSINKRQISSFLMLYWWYHYGMDQIWCKTKRFYKWTESKASLYKVWLQIWLQANRVPRHFNQYRSTK